MPLDDLRKLLDERHEQMMSRFDRIEDKTDANTAAIVEIKTDIKWMRGIAASVAAIVGGAVSILGTWFWGRESGA
jgi:hypothetical protein